jgi:imidazolonepropionase-like amidohydrolase
VHHEPFVISNVRVFSAREQSGWRRQDLIVSEGRFVSNRPNKCKVVRYPEHWILPGLIDAHTHICGETSEALASQYRYDEPVSSAIDRGLRNARSCVAAGITTIRDMGSFDRRSLLIRNLLQFEQHIGPRIICCGNAITGVGGHATAFCASTDDHGLECAVLSEIEAGADFIKIINDPVTFSLGALSDAVKLAHQNGLKVACHAYSHQSAILAIDANVDTLEHFSGGTSIILNKIAQRKAIIVPTCVSALDVVSNPSLALVGMDDAPIDTFEDWWADLQLYLPSTISNYSGVGVGTDSGFPPTHFGISVWREMGLLQNFGLGWRGCLIAATEINSSLLGRNTLGNLLPGSHADFVVTRVDPLRLGPETINHIESVYIAGQEVWRNHV